MLILLGTQINDLMENPKNYLTLITLVFSY